MKKKWISQIFTRLRCLFLLLFLSFFSVWPGEGYSQKTQKLLKVSNGTIVSVLKQIQQQESYRFFYDPSIVDVNCRVNFTFSEGTIEEIMKQMLGDKYAFKQNGNYIMIYKNVSSQKNEKRVSVSGVVKDKKNIPLQGVTVYIEGGITGTSTDKDGVYTLSMTKKDHMEIYYTYVGMKTVKIKYTGQPVIDVVMEESMNEMDEVVVVSTGYQNINSRKLTSAVTTLKMDNIKVDGLNSLTHMLEGHIPGMTFMQNSGQVGATPKVRIRGTSTILGNQEPLWVVDGIIQNDPVNIDPALLNDLDFVNLLGNAISGLNPEDIDQIDVLKDAAATAIYGARAANGVIVITTKKGEIGRPRVTYSMSGTVNRRPYYSDREVNMMNSKERVGVSREQFEKGMVFLNINNWFGFEKSYLDYKAGVIGYDQYKKDVDFYETINTDWFDLLCKNSFTNKHTLSLSGGTREFRYYVSLGYHDENGVIRKEGKDTYTANLKLNGNFKRAAFQFGVQFNTSEADYIPTDATGKNIIQYAYETSRAVPAFNPDGTPFYYAMGGFRSSNDAHMFNMLEETKNTKKHISMNSVTLTGNVRLHLLEGLHLDGTLSYSAANTNQETVFNEKSYYIKHLDMYDAGGSACPLGGEWRNQSSKQRSYTGRLQLDYNRYIGKSGKHFMSATAGTEVSSNKYNDLAIAERGYLEEYGRSFAQFTPEQLKSEDYKTYLQWLANNSPVINDKLTNMISGYLILSYNYDDRYLLNFNTRMDGSNQFGKRSNDKLLPVWSVSARWNIKKDFFNKCDVVNNLALKMSFGKQGNMLNNQTSRMIINKGSYTGWFDGFKSNIAYFPNPDLKWEKTSSFNTELEFSLLDNKIFGSIGYFYKKTKDAFLNKEISDINGINSYVINKGEVTNQGIEVALSFIPINRVFDGSGKRGFVWRIDPQLGQVVNSLVNKAINNRTHSIRDKVRYEDFLNGTVELPNKPLHTFYSYRLKGLDSKNGSPVYYGLETENAEELHKRFVSMTDEEICMEIMEESGTRVPIIQGGISNYFGYRQFGFSFNLTYSLGNKIRLLKVCENMNIRPYPVQNVRGEFNERWTKPGDEKYTNIPALVTENTLPRGWWDDHREDYSFADMSPYTMYDYSNSRVVRGDYLKIQSVSLRYNVHDSFCKKMGIQAAYFSLTGTNLKTFASKKLKGQSVEQSGSASTINLSVRPNYSISLNVTF